MTCRSFTADQPAESEQAQAWAAIWGRSNASGHVRPTPPRSGRACRRNQVARAGSESCGSRGAEVPATGGWQQCRPPFSLALKLWAGTHPRLRASAIEPAHHHLFAARKRDVYPPPLPIEYGRLANHLSDLGAGRRGSLGRRAGYRIGGCNAREPQCRRSADDRNRNRDRPEACARTATRRLLAAMCLCARGRHRAHLSRRIWISARTRR